jgi:4-amino-4-deoxy-L-arabinose transferase-like glycosyltransferase
VGIVAQDASGAGVVSLRCLNPAPASRRVPLLLAAAATLLYLVAASGRDFWAPDEPDFAEHVREMLERGSLLLPYENGKPYAEKPIFFYWAVAATTPLSGGDVHPLATRLPSILAGAALVFGAASLAGRRGGVREALAAGAATAVAPIVFWQAQFLQVDALFSCWLFAATVSLYFLESEEDGAGANRWRWVLRVSLAAAVLTKGPLAVVLAGLVVLTRCALRRSWAPLLATQPFRSILVFVALVVPWYVFAARAGGPAYAYDLVVNQNWNRFFRAFDHIQPWWFYFESIWSDFFPWTALALAAPFVLARAGLLRERPELRFAATAAAVSFVFLSLSQAKQGKYLLAAYPFAAVLVAALAVEAERRARAGRGGLLLAVRGWVAFAAILLFVGAVALAPTARRFVAEQAGLAPFAAIPIGLGAAGTIAVLVGRRREAVPALLALAVTLAAGEAAAGAVVFPAIDTLKTGKPFYERLRPRVSHGEPLAYFGETYRCYPILVLRRKTEHFRSDAALAEWVERTPGALVLADESERQHWTDARLSRLVVLDRQRVGGDEALLLGRP